MKKLICFLSLFVSLSAFALDGHPEGECGFRTKWGDYINLYGKVRIVGKGEMADVNVYVWKPSKKTNIISGTPEMVVKLVHSNSYWCGEFQIVKSGEDFTVKLVDEGDQADIIVVLGEPRESYPNDHAF